MKLTKDRSFYLWFFRLTLTIALQNLVVFSVNLADNIMLGAYQETSLSGVALVNQIQFLLQMLTMGVGKELWFCLLSTGENGILQASNEY